MEQKLISDFEAAKAEWKLNKNSRAPQVRGAAYKALTIAATALNIWADENNRPDLIERNLYGRYFTSSKG